MLTDIQKQKVAEGIAILKQYKILYLMFETQVGKTPTSLSIAQELSDNILFVTTKKMIKEIPSYLTKFNIIANVKPVSMDSLHKEKYIPGRIIIMDEGHSYGSYPKPALRAKKMREIAKDNCLIILSATPTPEKYSQFYHQFWVSDHSPFKEYKSFYRWADDYVKIKEKFLGAIRVKDYSDANIEKIEAKCKHLFLTLTKEQAGFIQTKVSETLIKVNMQAITKQLYSQLKKDAYAVISIADQCHEIVGDTPAKLMSKLHQLCGGTIITESGESFIIDVSKINYINQNLLNSKIAIYYKFKAERESLIKYLKKQITEDVNEFRESDDKVFISQFQSGREGISLATADCLIFYNIDYSFLSYEQTKNRVTNMMRTSQPKIMFLLSDLDLDSRILKVVKNKKTFTTRHFERA